MNTTFHSRASRDVRHRRRSVARRDVVSPGARLVRVEHEHVGRVEGGSIKPIATRPLVWNFSTFQPFNFSTSYVTLGWRLTMNLEGGGLAHQISIGMKMRHLPKTRENTIVWKWIVRVGQKS